MVACNHILQKKYNKIIVVNNHKHGSYNYEQCKSCVGIKDCRIIKRKEHDKISLGNEQWSNALYIEKHNT